MTISAKEKRLIEVRFALAQMKEILHPDGYEADAPLIGHKEGNAVLAFLRTIQWKEDTRGSLLTSLMEQICGSVGEAEFYPAPLLEVVRVLEERVPQDVDFSPAKDREKK